MLSSFISFPEEKEIPFMSHTFCLSNIPFLCPNKCNLFDSSFLLSNLSSYWFLHSFSLHYPMVPEIEKPRVTEVQVRMDCNGCVQKIKKALHGINGIYDLYIDFPQQKLTIIGWADTEKIVKAIRKTRKIATICSQSESSSEPVDAQPAEQPQQTEETQQATDGSTPEPAPAPAPTPAPEPAANPPLAEAPPAEAAAPAEPPKDPPPPENPQPEERPLPTPIAEETNNANQPAHPPRPKDVGDVHFIYHHPPINGYKYGYSNSYGGNWNRYHNTQGFPPDPPQPIYVSHSYNTYRPSPYVTEYQYVHSSPPRHTIHNRMDHYNEEFHELSRNGNGNITSIFSDENPNACTIV